jgi:hypothetical protein
MLIFCVGSILFGMFGVMRLGWEKLRRVAAIDAAFEAISICAEKGRPMVYHPGSLSVLQGNPYVPSILELVKFFAVKAGEAGVRIVTSCYVHPLLRTQLADYTKQGYITSGHPELFREEDHKYYPDYITGTQGTIGIVHDEKPGAAVIVGSHWWYSSTAIVEAAVVEGAFTIAGSAAPDDNCGNVIAADYVVFSEEALAMGAYLSDDPMDGAILVGEDFFKIVLIIGIVGMFLVTLLGVV